jgi:hypothetical protein
MTESARDEALRLAMECGFDPGRGPILDQFERLIALARQRPGWVWVPEEPTEAMVHAYWLDIETPMLSYETPRAALTSRWKALLAAVPAPGKEST